MESNIYNENASVAEKLIHCMKEADSSEFCRLTKTYDEFRNSEERAKLVVDLSNIASNARIADRIKAVELLGILKGAEAEATLSEIFKIIFTDENIPKLVKESDAVLEMRFLLIRVVTALLLIDASKWLSSAKDVSSKFSGTWVGRCVDEDIAKAESTSKP